MPEAAWEATERQFIELIRAATSDVVVRLKLFSIPDMPRAGPLREELTRRYRDVSELWNAHVDGLIVTGTEPRAQSLDREPYWPAFVKLVDWAKDNTVSTVWSCLAAHAAVFHCDGIERRPFTDKLFGVFDCEAAADDPLLADVAPRPSIPHSRYNDLPEQALTSCGYRTLTRSPIAGVDMFVKDAENRSLFVFFQGHPEYDTDTLLREYRRDIGRFLRGEREGYPSAPRNYLNQAGEFLAEDFRVRAIGDRRSSLLGNFPMAVLEGGTENTWRHAASGIYRNWIRYLMDRKTTQRPPLDFGQRSRRRASNVFAG
jgi:homoserine O-succinyltransferase